MAFFCLHLGFSSSLRIIRRFSIQPEKNGFLFLFFVLRNIWSSGRWWRKTRVRMVQQYNLPRPKLIKAADVLRVGGRIPRRVEAPVKGRELRTHEQIIAHLVGHGLSVRLEDACRQKIRYHSFSTRIFGVLN